MSWRFWTIAIMAGCASVVIVWDIVVALYAKNLSRTTVSGVTLGWANKWWGMPFAFGVLGGHLFMRGTLFFPHPLMGGPLLMAMAIILVVVGHHLTTVDQPKWRQVLRAFALINLGLVSGHLLWPQGGG